MLARLSHPTANDLRNDGGFWLQFLPKHNGEPICFCNDPGESADIERCCKERLKLLRSLDLIPANYVWMALNTAAFETGVRLLNPRQISSTTWSFRLALSDLDIHQVEWDTWVPDRRKGRQGEQRSVIRVCPRYTRLNAGLTRRVAAVCWHGHRDFMLRFFAQLPQAHIISHLDHWRGQDDFVARHKDSQYKNIGSQMYPISYAEACIC